MRTMPPPPDGCRTTSPMTTSLRSRSVNAGTTPCCIGRMGPCIRSAKKQAKNKQLQKEGRLVIPQRKHSNAKSFSCYMTPNGRPPRPRRNIRPGLPFVLVAKDAFMDCGLLAGCAVCQQTKTSPIARTPHCTASHLRGHTPFQQIALDLITGLPPNGPHDSVLTIVDHGCSQAAIFLPCATTITGPEVAQLYFDNVYRWFGLPSKIISDRDPRFTSHFGRALANKIGAKQKSSTAFHPQTNGLSEQKNQWVEQYLCLVANAQQRDWSRLAHSASAVHTITSFYARCNPIETLLGYRPTLSPRSECDGRTIRWRNNILRPCIKNALSNCGNQQGGESRPNPERKFKEGDQVWFRGIEPETALSHPKVSPQTSRTLLHQQRISRWLIDLPSPCHGASMTYFTLPSSYPIRETAAHRPQLSARPPLI